MKYKSYVVKRHSFVPKHFARSAKKKIYTPPQGGCKFFFSRFARNVLVQNYVASRHSFCISCFSFLYYASSFLILHCLLSSILCNMSEFIQFSFFVSCSSPQISSATITIPSFNCFQISPISIH